MVGERPPSQYIPLDLPGHKSSETVRHWVGYKEVFDVSEVNDSGLVRVALSLTVPQHYRKIPRELERFHVNGYWFRIYEVKGEKRICGFPAMMREYFHKISSKLIFSEDYIEVMEEIRKRGLVEKVRLEKKRMRRKGMARLDMSIMSPEVEEMMRRTKPVLETKPRNIILRRSIPLTARVLA